VYRPLADLWSSAHLHYIIINQWERLYYYLFISEILLEVNLKNYSPILILPGHAWLQGQHCSNTMLGVLHLRWTRVTIRSSPLHLWQIKSEFRILALLFSIQCSSGWLRSIKMHLTKDHATITCREKNCKQWRHVEKTVDFVMNLCLPNTQERYLQKLF
jgi:hypothetical protein